MNSPFEEISPYQINYLPTAFLINSKHFFLENLIEGNYNETLYLNVQRRNTFTNYKMKTFISLENIDSIFTLPTSAFYDQTIDLIPDKRRLYYISAKTKR